MSNIVLVLIQAGLIGLTFGLWQDNRFAGWFMTLLVFNYMMVHLEGKRL